MKAGAVYFALGERYIQEARASAERLREVMPELPIALYTDDDEWGSPWDSIIEVPSRAIDLNIVRGQGAAEDASHALAVRARHLADALRLFDKVLYLDTDTYVVEPVWELFDLLNRFDVAMAHAPSRDNMVETDIVAGIPACFPTPQCGVIAFTKWATPLLDMWWLNYLVQLNAGWRGTDQPAMRRALWRVNDWTRDRPAFAVLPPEYNLRLPFPAQLDGPVKIIHGRHPDMAGLAARLNEHTGIRAYVPSGNVVK